MSETEIPAIDEMVAEAVVVRTGEDTESVSWRGHHAGWLREAPAWMGEGYLLPYGSVVPRELALQVAVANLHIDIDRAVREGNKSRVEFLLSETGL